MTSPNEEKSMFLFRTRKTGESERAILKLDDELLDSMAVHRKSRDDDDESTMSHFRFRQCCHNV